MGLTLLVVMGSQGATLLTVLAYAEREVAARTQEDLQRATRLFEQTSAHRARSLQQLLKPLTDDPVLKQLLLVGEHTAFAESLASRAEWGEGSITFLLGPDGAVLATSGVRSNIPTQLPEMTAQTRGLFATDQTIYELTSAPLRNPGIAAWIAVGIPITDLLADGAARLTGLDVTLFSTTTFGQIRLLASSLSLGERDMLMTASQKVADGMNYKLATHEVAKLFRSAQLDFIPGDGRVSVLLHRRVVEARAPFVQLRETMLQAAGVSLLGALILALLLSHAVTNPIRQLLLAARRMGAGDYSHELEIDTRDEFGELAKTFEDMRTGIAEREQQIVYQAEVDSLTGLPNRIHAMELLRNSLGEATKSGKPITVMIMHLQRFREIQSSLGHEVGDEVLRQTAQRLRGSLNDGHILARLEGDQFLIIASDTDKEKAKQLAGSLASALDAGLSVQSVNVTLDLCIGFCVSPEHGRQPDELLRRAAVAKNDAHNSAKRIWIYQNGREAHHVRQLAILGDLRRAVIESELQLFLQPKVTLHDTQVCGAEALLRWDHPELGQIPPFEFIPLAESAGCINMITEWVLEKAVSQCRSWRDQGIYMPIAVNLSAQDLLNDNLSVLIEHELDAFGMDPGCLVLEITEEAVVRDLEQAVRTLNRLRAMGTRISMDDFGTGYSSLSHLQKLPIDELKIDRAFVTQLPHDRRNAAIVRAIIDLAHNVGIEVVAEGVESTAALRWLRQQGCERAQGFYLSKPMPAEKFVPWMRNWEQLARKDQNANANANMNDSLILRPRLIT